MLLAEAMERAKNGDRIELSHGLSTPPGEGFFTKWAEVKVTEHGTFLCNNWPLKLVELLCDKWRRRCRFCGEDCDECYRWDGEGEG